jgi:hypothetical protein
MRELKKYSRAFGNIGCSGLRSGNAKRTWF